VPLNGWICSGEQELRFVTYKSVIQSPEVFPVNVGKFWYVVADIVFAVIPL
jgi:hypothetical protein